MKRDQLPLSAEQIELLLAFERCASLQNLAEMMIKDPSVVSRNLQRLAEVLPVLEKQNRRWQITELGRAINARSRSFLMEMQGLIDQYSTPNSTNPMESCFSSHAVLLVVNAQRALLQDTRHRNNDDAGNSILKLLQNYRSKNQTVIHVKHVSKNPNSSFCIGKESSEFIEPLAPINNEIVIAKSNSSAFTDTELNATLTNLKAEALIIVGFTTSDCIAATAKDASELAYDTYVVSDATAMFDISSPDGRLLKANRVQELTLANINTFFGKVVSTEFLTRLSY